MLNWFVAQFWSGREYAAARTLAGHLPDGSVIPNHPRAFCPVERKRWVTRGAKHDALVPVLSSYVFVEMERGDPYRWHDVAGQPGFLRFIGIAYREVVHGMMLRASGDWVMAFEEPEALAPILQKGDRVRLPLSDGLGKPMEGVIEWFQGAGVAWVSTRGFFQHEQQRIPISISKLEKISISGKRQRPNLEQLPLAAVGT